MTNDTAILKIRCPHCGAVLAVKNIPNIETKSVTCPICKQKSPFVNYKVLPQAPQQQADPGTDLPQSQQSQVTGTGERTQYRQAADHDKTQFTAANAPKLAVGRLVISSTGQHFQLHAGTNIVGRKASASSADIPIPTGEEKHMSREHLVVTVTRKPGQGFMHVAKLYKPHVNKTSVNGVQMMYGDEVILNNGDTLQLPDVTLRFEIPDDEGTDY